jgi:hypothetical protein
VNEQELREYMDGRGPSPHVARLDVAALHCYGCAHSAASAPPPGMPSGERPCCSCVRNPEMEEWARDSGAASGVTPGDLLASSTAVVGSDGHARIFNPFVGTLYNGAPRPYFPMDNYVTMDHGDQEQFLDKHPEYAGAVNGAGDPVQPAWVTQLCTIDHTEPLDSEAVAAGFDGTVPCNGLPRPDCPGYAAWLATQ